MNMSKPFIILNVVPSVYSYSKSSYFIYAILFTKNNPYLIDVVNVSTILYTIFCSIFLTIHNSFYQSGLLRNKYMKQ